MPATERDRESISDKTARGAGWLIGWRMATRLLGLASTLVLVRILSPADFGLVALATTLSLGIDMLSWIGVWDQLVREDAPDRAMYDTAFTLSALRGVMTAAVVAGSGPFVSRFFNEPRLDGIMLALGICALADGLVNIGTAEFRRTFSFEKEFQLFVVPRIAQVTATITAAFVLRDYRALIVGLLVLRALRLVCSYWLHPYRPRLGLAAWRRMAGFSGWTWAVAVTMLARDRTDSLVIGRVLGPGPLGVYAVGLELAALPITELIEPLGRVLFSSFTAVRMAGSGLADAYGRVLGAIAVLLLPATFGISLVADPLTRLMFGVRWAGAAPLVEIMAVAGVLRVFSIIGGTLLTSHGLPRITCQILLAALCVRVPLIVIGVERGGLVGCAWGVLAGTAAEEILFLIVTMRRVGLEVRALGHQLWRPVLAALVMAAVLAGCGLGWRGEPSGTSAAFAELARAMVTGAVVYAAALLALWSLSGRPRGAETELAQMGYGLVRRVAGMAQRRLARARPDLSA